mmetsp:Transcript_64447/g.89590  ORF Transcript_64447/g.89590 Transcript_64447/m.89590 type:complete len:213 (-) Transcript_64447:243-881(-)
MSWTISCPLAAPFTFCSPAMNSSGVTKPLWFTSMISKRLSASSKPIPNKPSFFTSEGILIIFLNSFCDKSPLPSRSFAWSSSTTDSRRIASMRLRDCSARRRLSAVITEIRSTITATKMLRVPKLITKISRNTAGPAMGATRKRGRATLSAQSSKVATWRVVNIARRTEPRYMGCKYQYSKAKRSCPPSTQSAAPKQKMKIAIAKAIHSTVL